MENDFIRELKFIDQFVKIKIKNSIDPLIGWLYTVDPVSNSFVLVKFLAQKPTEVTVVMGENIENLSLASDSCQLDNNMIDLIKSSLKNLFLPINEATSDFMKEKSYVTKRKSEMVAWLTKNRLPVKLDELDVINILDTVFIDAPYGLNDCKSTNEIILDKVRQLVRNLPE